MILGGAGGSAGAAAFASLGRRLFGCLLGRPLLGLRRLLCGLLLGPRLLRCGLLGRLLSASAFWRPPLRLWIAGGGGGGGGGAGCPRFFENESQSKSPAVQSVVCFARSCVVAGACASMATTDAGVASTDPAIVAAAAAAMARVANVAPASRIRGGSGFSTRPYVGASSAESQTLSSMAVVGDSSSRVCCARDSATLVMCLACHGLHLTTTTVRQTDKPSRPGASRLLGNGRRCRETFMA